jgi:hypoxanthine phosphoribosyltransferase
MKILDKEFEIFIPKEKIQLRIQELASDLSSKLEGKDPLFIAILNGAFMFASDLFKEIEIPARITFVKTTSYVGTETTGRVQQLIGLKEDISGQHIVLVDDIFDTGLTMQAVCEEMRKKNPASISVLTLLDKVSKHKTDLAIDFKGFEIPDKFVLGYGLDYNGYGRNLKDIYALAE